MDRVEVFTGVRALAATSLIALGGCATNALENADKQSMPEASSALGSLLPVGNELSPRTEIYSNDVAQRQALVDERIDDLQRLADDIEDPQAIAVVAFLQAGGLMSPQESGGFQVLTSPTTPQAPFLAPWVTSDTDVNPAMAGLLDEAGAVASYNPDLNVITLMEDADVSPVFRAVVTLHEANQAHEYMTSPYDWRDPKQFTLHKLSTHEFENRILELIGGPKYTVFVEQYALELATAIQASPEKNVVPAHGDYRPELDRIFGLSLSDSEDKLRQTHVWLDAAFRANRNMYGESAGQHNFDLLYSLYRRNGLLPS